MQVRSYLYLFHTLGVDYVPTSTSGNKWILTLFALGEGGLRVFAKYLKNGLAKLYETL